jgi:hypothetical protein
MRLQDFDRISVRPMIDEKRSAQLIALMNGVAVEVVDRAAPRDVWRVAAARIWQDLQEFLKSDRPQIGVAIGSGRSVMSVCRHLFQEVDRGRHSLPDNALGRIHLYPMAAAIDIDRAFENVPSLFLNSFIKKQGLAVLAPNIHVTPHATFRNQKLTWLKKQIDLVITSVADFQHRHSSLPSYLDKLGARVDELPAVGDVQFRLFSDVGFVTEARMVRGISSRPIPTPSTLCELDDLVELAKTPKKSVFMVTGPCAVPQCGTLKHKALLPLIRNPEMRLFNRLIIDSATADGVLNHWPHRSVRPTAKSRRR